MAIRKYLSEFGLNMFGEMKVLAQQDGLGVIKESGIGSKYPFHIYMVGRRPRITLNPNSIEIDDKIIKCQFQIQRGNTFEPHTFIARNGFGTTKISLDCPYPHTEFIFRDEQGEQLLKGKTAVLMGMVFPNSWSLLKLEVLYIGQSYGIEGARTAPERLANHSTLQAIYADGIKSFPDQEIWLILWNFEPQLLASFDGITKKYGTTIEEDDKHTEEVIKNPVSEQQRINFTEAALIKYFEPEYNIKYKTRFPNPAHKTYSECYNLDLNLVSFSLTTDDIGCQLWSKKVPPKWTHSAQYELDSSEERKSMLNPF
jgi:hypothetical protein